MKLPAGIVRKLPNLAPPDMKPVLVIWKDAMATNPTETYTEFEISMLGPLVMYDVGFMNASDGAVTLTGNISEQGAQRRSLVIPNEMIVAIIELKPGRVLSKETP